MYSLRDSIIKPEELVEKLKKLGQDAVAITDHGTSLGGVSIYKLLKKNGIKYIHGCEFYSCDSVKIKDKDNKYYHLVVLCKNEQGRQNLNKLISISGHPDNKYVKPRIDFALLSQYGEGLIVLSACLAGEVSKLLMGGDYESAKQVSLKYKERFKGDYYLEIQSHSDETQIKTNKQIIKICKETGIECVVTCDAHYVNKADKKYQNKYAFNGAYKEDGEAYIDCFIQSENEVRERIDYLEPAIIDSAIKNTEIISRKCNVEIPLSAPIMPTIETPDTFRNNKDWLMSLCIRGFEEKLNIDYLNCKIKDENRKLKMAVYADDEDGDGEFVEWREYQLTQEEVNTYIDRYEYELNSLERMGFIDYILLVYSYANVGKRRGIARGSGGGSLINYITNITNIDPIEHGLYFERFIDVGALDLLESGEITPNELKIPDIDLDFSGESCNDVLHWLYNKYGEERVASIGKFGTNQTKGSIRDFCKVLDIDIETADRIAKAFSSYELDDIDAMLGGVVKPVASANDAIYFVNNYPELFDYVRKLNGLPKSFGLHACGKVISTKELDYYLPSCYDADGIRYLQGDMHDVEDVGLVKIDVLGLRTLDQEYDTLEMTEESEEFINPKQDFHDKKVLDIFKNGNTIGIFQMASSGMKQTLKKMDVRGIDDISVANALFRPGAMAYIDSFCKRRSGTESFEYLHPDLEPILKSTYGIIVFQEQLIEIGRIAGIRNPDLLRKATGKKDPKLLEQVKPELEEKLKARGWNDKQFDQLWSDMIEFSRYSFNKCVSGNTTLMKAGQKKCVRNPSVEEMYLVMNDLDYAKKNSFMPLRSKYLRVGYPNALSMCSDSRIRKNKIVDIQPSGIRKTYRLTTEKGMYIESTDNHKFPTPTGHKTLSELNIGDEVFIVGEYKKQQKSYNLTDGNYEKNTPKKGQKGFQLIPNGMYAIFEHFKKHMRDTKSQCNECGCDYDELIRFELHHVDGDRKNNNTNNYKWCCVSCHKKLDYQLGRTKAYENGIPTMVDKVKSIEYVKTNMTYDVTMADPAHNFVANNGLVVCNSHASAYAIIAYMTAKQKAYYPAEFYAGLCNSYLNKSSFVKDNVYEIFEDMNQNKITFAKFDYMQDHRRCSVQNGKILYAIPLIRECNQHLADTVNTLKQMEFNYFSDVILYLLENKVQKGQIKILVLLGFFDRFGNPKELLRILSFMESFKFGDMKKIDKEKIADDNIENIISNYSTYSNKKEDGLGKYIFTNGSIELLQEKFKPLRKRELAYEKKKETPPDYFAIEILEVKNLIKSEYAFLFKQFFNDCEKFIKTLCIHDFSFKEKIASHMEYLGFVNLTTNKEEDRRKLLLMNVVPLKSKDSAEIWGYALFTQSIGSGKMARLTLKSELYNIEPVKKMDIIFAKSVDKNKSGWWYLYDYEVII